MTSQRGQQATRETAVVEVENIGGIGHTIVEFGPGPTVLSGRNATNRSSFLRSIMAALGSDRPALKADAEEGYVRLTIDGETYTRTFRRTDNGVIRSGSPYLEDASDADLFAFLLEDNEARIAIERGQNLRELMMQPVDTDRIESEINRLQAERDEIDRQLGEIDDLRRTRDAIDEEREEIADKIESVKDRRESIDDPTDRIAEETGSREELTEVLAELRDKRGELEDTQFEMTTEQESIEALESDLESIQTAIEELPDHPEHRLDELEREIDRLQSLESDLESQISQLGSVSEFNQRMLDQQDHPFGGEDTAPHELADDDEGSVTCWTCGTDVSEEAIDGTLDLLDELRREKVEERSTVTANLREAREQRADLKRKQANRDQLEAERETIREDIEQRRDRIVDLEERKSMLGDHIASLEETVANLEDDDYDDLLAEQRQHNQLEFELNRLEDEYERLTDNLEELQQTLDRTDTLEERREEISEELVELRTRVERIETEAVEAFNQHMAELLDLLDYQNIARVWIERRADEESRGEPTRTFVPHVVRTGEDGATYEDSVDHLSESEREVIGLVFALAGYLVHELHEDLPFVLLDSLEVIDAERIAAIVDYFAEYADMLVVALLPEDAAAIDEDIERVTDLGETSQSMQGSSA